MCNTCRASGNGKNSVFCVISFFSLFFLRLSVFFIFLFIYYREKFLGSFCISESLAKFGFHQHNHKPRENFKMQIAVHRCGNHKDNIRRFIVRSTVINAAVNRHSRKTRDFYAVALCVRNCDSLTDSGCSLLLTEQNCLFIGVFVGKISDCVMKRNEPVYGIVLRCELNIKIYRIRF